MKPILAVTALIAAVFISGCSSFGLYEELKDTHIGVAVLKEPAREAPENPYEDTGTIHDKTYAPFTKWRRVCGLTFAAYDTIPDAFLEEIADVMKSMFPDNAAGIDKQKQEEVLSDLYRYNALLPVVTSESEVPESNPDFKHIQKTHSICDIIMRTDDHQAMEVLEHLLHAVTDVGMHYTYTDKWGLSKQSSLYRLMNQAVDKKYYDISDYKFPGVPEEIITRITLQEYAYWVISSQWNLQTAYGPEPSSEWRLYTPQLLEGSQPEMTALIKATVTEVMTKPSTALLDILEK